MLDIPLTPFRGHLKQVAISDLADGHRSLFAVLFPRFFDRFELKLQDDMLRLLNALRPLVQVQEPAQARRFRGPMLSRGRYLRILRLRRKRWRDARSRASRLPRSGQNRHGRGHRSRAGRRHGRHPQRRFISFRAHSGASRVLIHDPERVGGLLEQVPHQELRSRGGRAVTMVRFPYLIRETQISRTVDLRQPQTQAWFAEQFSKPCDGILWPRRCPRWRRQNRPGRSLRSIRTSWVVRRYRGRFSKCCQLC